MTLAAAGIAVAATVSRPVLTLAANSMAEFSVGLLASALLAIFLLFSIPGISARRGQPVGLASCPAEQATTSHTGQIAGRLNAISTTGSLVGTFLPVLWLIPTVGTRWTFFLLALALLTVITLGSSQRDLSLGTHGDARERVAAGTLHTPRSPPHSWPMPRRERCIYADESLYNTIVVRQWGPERHLKLNEGIGLHSVYHPQMF